MKIYEEILKKYEELNKNAKPGGIVFFGTDWMAEVPISEMAKDNGFTQNVYNRSVKGFLIKDSEKLINPCIEKLNPKKVFINVGENDIKSEDFSVEEFLEKYEWMLYTIHTSCKCDIYILSLLDDTNGKVNDALAKLAKSYGCEYIDIGACKNSYSGFFSRVRFFMRSHPITFFEAMTM